MALLDEFGRTISYKAARAANDTRHRPYEPVEKKDISQLVPSLDRVKLLSHARRIYLNFGPIKNAINQRSMYSVGRAFVPQFKGGDSEFGNVATDWLTGNFYAIGDTRGGMHDLKTNLFGSSFYTLTGFHGVHVTVGVIMLLSVVGMIAKKRTAEDKSELVELVGLYWHFVDVVWILIFTLVYLIPA